MLTVGMCVLALVHVWVSLTALATGEHEILCIRSDARKSWTHRREKLSIQFAVFWFGDFHPLRIRKSIAYGL